MVRTQGEFLISNSPTPEEITRIREEVDRFNQVATDGRFYFPGTEDSGLAFDLAVRDPSGTIVGGINVSSILGVMWLEVLWIAEPYRRRGLAGWLVLEAERAAYERGCVGAGTWTFDWQGADFYPRIGYALRGIYDGYPAGMTEHVLTKRLPSPRTVRNDAARRVERSLRDGFTLVDEPTEEEMSVVRDGLEAYCVARGGDKRKDSGYRIHLVLRDRRTDFAGGLVARTEMRALVLEELWIDGRHRGRGLGRGLVTEAERTARSHGCIGAQGCCLCFQSPAFFRRLGYETFGTVDVYPDGYTEELLIKRFDGSRPSPGAT